MKKKFLWVGLSFLLVASLVLASCAEEVVAPPGEEEEVVEEEEEVVEEEEEEEVVVPVPGEPQYGGTFTFTYWTITKADPPSPDIQDELYISTRWLSPVQEMPLIADFEKYGPRGTGESLFSAAGYIPDKFQKGHLLESWEITPEKVTWQVRPGIYWAADNVDWMENREFTAQDMVDDLLYFKAAVSKGKFLRDLTGDIYATSKYTLVIETPGGFDLTLMYKIGYEDRALISPPEMVVAGADKWENQVGTGPFMFKEYVIGSHMTFERNPNYWDTTIINGVEYQIPFFDEWIQPIIPDASTLVAALRTGKIDFNWSTDARHWETLDRTAPELISLKSPGSSGFMIYLNVDEPPLDNIDVRRALMIGTNIKAFGDLLGIGPVPILFYPVLPGTGGVFTPVEDLPASSRELFDYNPTLAKQMIADVYPDGLEIEYYAESEAFALDQASLLKFQWEKIGVDVTIKSFDTVTHDKHLYDRTYQDTLGARHGSASPVAMLEWSVTGGALNWTGYSNEWFDEQFALVVTTIDADERNRMLKAMNLLIISEVHTIGLSPTPEASYWWPWVKNYYGESSVLDKAIAPILARAWLDQTLKAEMGY